MVEIKVWNSTESYKSGAKPYMVMTCKTCFLSTAFCFVRHTFEPDFVCLITNADN